MSTLSAQTLKKRYKSRVVVKDVSLEVASGDQFTVADGYCLVFYGWGLRGELPMTKLANYTAFKDRMLKRPKVMKVLQSEKSVLIA